MTHQILILALVPLTVVASFFIHWLTIVHIKTAEERLPFCRGAYLAFSFQLVLYSWIIFKFTGADLLLSILVPAGMTFSFVGDIFNLQFSPVVKKVGQPIFFGIISFSIAQLCYITAFLLMIPLSALINNGYYIPVLIFFLVVPTILFRLRVYNPRRSSLIMNGAFIYGFILGAMAATTISAAIAEGGAWFFIAGGALCFLLSDAVMGETTIYGRHPVFEYQVPWVTYIAAQGLILFGNALTTF